MLFSPDSMEKVLMLSIQMKLFTNRFLYSGWRWATPQKLLPSLHSYSLCLFYHNFPITIKFVKTVRKALSLISLANDHTIAHLYFKTKLYVSIWTYSITPLPQSAMHLFLALNSLLSCGKAFDRCSPIPPGTPFFPYFQWVPVHDPLPFSLLAVLFHVWMCFMCPYGLFFWVLGMVKT